jgi:predicted nucleotidyltransferase
MQEELKEIFVREVDLVEKAGLRNPFRRQAILTNKELSAME